MWETFNEVPRDLRFIATHLEDWPGDSTSVALDNDGEIMFKGGEYYVDFYPLGSRECKDYAEHYLDGEDYSKDQWRSARMLYEVWSGKVFNPGQEVYVSGHGEGVIVTYHKNKAKVEGYLVELKSGPYKLCNHESIRAKDPKEEEWCAGASEVFMEAGDGKICDRAFQAIYKAMTAGLLKVPRL